MAKPRTISALVDTGDGGVSTIPSPALHWVDVLYGDIGAMRSEIDAMLSSFDGLLSNSLTSREAIQRLRLLRRARKSSAPIAS